MNFLSSPLNRTLLLAAFAVLIGLFGYIMMIQPALNNLSQSQARLQQDQQNYADLKRVADQKPVYLALTQRIQTRLKSTERTADPRAYIPSYLKQIEKLAQGDGLMVTSVTPQATPSPSPSPSAGGSPNPQALRGIAPINAAANAAGGANAQAQTTNGVAAATGATPIPGAPPPPPSGVARNGGAGPLQTGSTTSARANAIAYLNTSFVLVPMNLELSGTYAQLQKFLKDLNGFPKLIGVGNVTLTPGTRHAVGETPTLNIILPVIAYRLTAASAGTIAPMPLVSPNPSGVGGNGG
jgi:Tfp pilus assembly protein PilO